MIQIEQRDFSFCFETLLSWISALLQFHFIRVFPIFFGMLVLHYFVLFLFPN